MTYRLFRYCDTAGVARPGIVTAHGYFDLGYSDVDALVQNWAAAHEQLKAITLALAGSTSAAEEARLDPETLSFAPPLGRPGVIYAAGANYRDHVEAMGRAFNMQLTLDPRAEGIPPRHFIKAGRATLTGHQQDVPYPDRTSRLGWEAELAVVIGMTANQVSVADALAHVAGYTIANNLSARDSLIRDIVDAASPFRFDWVGHKCFTGSCPLGPYMTPAEFVPSPEDLDVKLWINEELRQDSNTRNHLYSVAEQISYLSERLILYPGDIILTGTPAGVGMETGSFLVRGDVIRIQIESLGELETTIV
ncbi:2-keto-4-pentenoate hydratase [Cupriavidus sp. UYMMa02A]|nr:2-keto-4-pentenoate hydratase [Cupriavidus sp. UYMMa02A]